MVSGKPLSLAGTRYKTALIGQCHFLNIRLVPQVYVVEMLWRDLKLLQIYGANTNVGKTIVSTVLSKALQRRVPDGGLLYLKPVSTGPLEEADDRHISKYVRGVTSKCISQFSDPVSPHLASARDGTSPGNTASTDESILAQIKRALDSHAQSGGQYGLLETAGGVLSPGPSGTLQSDLYRPLRLPVLLVGDHRLGGISSTLSAFESLHIRGYDVDSIVLFEDSQWCNYPYLRDHFVKHEIPAFALPMPPARRESSKEDELAMSEYYENASSLPAVSTLIEHMQEKHYKRISKISSMPALAESVIWHPFRQYGLSQDIIAIDSAYGDNFQAYTPPAELSAPSKPVSPLSALAPMSRPSESNSMLTPLFDGSASWWTQGLGHGNPTLSLTAAHAAGRYGHVMFANAVHEPAFDLSYNLLSRLANPRLSRVFFTDNGSTGMEVAVKMALRISCAKNGWNKEHDEIEILGLAGSYHGDTIGVMNCSEPSPFNEKVDWHRPLGFWFNPPQIKMRKGIWELTIPKDISAGAADELASEQVIKFNKLSDIFDFSIRDEAGHYKEIIEQTLSRLMGTQKRKFGALILEPLIMGAGGMIFVDPLFQRTLIQVCRTNFEHPIPIIADEVFTGLYRFGRASSSSFLSCPSNSGSQPLNVDIAPDISVHAKLLTGGLLPLAITAASEEIFEVFLSERKQDALLHGHSYTAHAVGCSVANASLKEMEGMDMAGGWDGFKGAWIKGTVSTTTQAQAAPSQALVAGSEGAETTIWSFWSLPTITQLSHSPRVSGIWAVGTVLAITLRSDGGGYTSNAAASLQNELLTLRDEEGAGVHSRVLGDVLYLMTSLTTKEEAVRRIEGGLKRTLCRMDMEG